MLFDPITIKNLRIRNRTAMAPMEVRLAGRGGEVTDRAIAYYRARAAGGVGLVIVEFTCVDRLDGLGAHQPQFMLDSDALIATQQRLASAIKAEGASAAIQLSHAGRQALPHVIGRPIVAPSAVALGALIPRPLEDHEIHRIICSYATAARRAIDAGYDAVMLHGAHGYLLSQFLSPRLNRRDDAWGGDFERRMRFPLEVIRAVKAQIGDAPLLYRMSVDEFMKGGQTIEDSERIVPFLVAAGVDALDISFATVERFDKILESMDVDEGWRLPYARRIRRAAGVPVLCAGVMRWPDKAEAALANGDCDIVSMGRALLADPEWPNKAREGRAAHIVPCTSCNWCLAQLAAHRSIGCAENPQCGHETDATVPAFGRHRRAVVVGSGPGGMAAALYLHSAGFAVDLLEKRDTLGGGLVTSATPPGKDKLFWYRDYLVARIKETDIRTQLGTHASVEMIAAMEPTLVALCTGVNPKPFRIEGNFQGSIVGHAAALLLGEDQVGPQHEGAPVIVYGGGETGCETAEWLAERCPQVMLITRSPAASLARGAEALYRSALRRRLAKNPRVQICDNTTISHIDGNQVHLIDAAGSSAVVTASRLFIAQGSEADDRLQTGLAARKILHFTIGDAARIGRIGDAVHAALAALKDAAWHLEGQGEAPAARRAREHHADFNEHDFELAAEAVGRLPA